jgi:hypothetical protein
MTVATLPVKSFTFPGGYPLFYYVHADGEHLHCCPDCVNKNDFETIDETVPHINWECHDLVCDVCDELIESAY